MHWRNAKNVKRNLKILTKVKKKKKVVYRIVKLWLAYFLEYVLPASAYSDVDKAFMSILCMILQKSTQNHDLFLFPGILECATIVRGEANVKLQCFEPITLLSFALIIRRVSMLWCWITAKTIARIMFTMLPILLQHVKGTYYISLTFWPYDGPLAWL